MAEINREKRQTMMNKVILMGRLTKSPELRHTSQKNTAVCTFTLAVNRRFAKKGEGDQADFPVIVVWGKLAEFCAKYFLKGKQVSIVGSIRTRNYADKEGKKHYITEVVADEAYFADGKGTAGSDQGEPSHPKKSVATTAFSEDLSRNPISTTQVDGDGFYLLSEDDEDLPF